MNPNVQTALAVAALGVGAIVAYPLVKGLRETAEGAQEFGEGVGKFTGGVGKFFGDIGDTIRNDAPTVDPTPPPNDGKARLPLELAEVSSVNKGGRGVYGKKKTRATLRVTSNGQPVAGALITGTFVHKAYNNRTKLREYTNHQGEAEFLWQVTDRPGTDTDDDVRFEATKAGYTPSNRVTVL